MNLKNERVEVRDSVDTSYILERSKFVNVDKTFADRKWVWVPDGKMTFLPGYIVKEEEDTLEVDCDGSVFTFKSSEVMRMNPPKFDMAEDLAALSHLNEPSVLFNLTRRYNHGHIYTYSGLFLLAINPYRDLNIYTPKHIKKYTMSKKNELEPHIFAVANESYNLMLSNRENQSILITGESGAGKTENTKKVIEFLASVAGYKTEDISIDKKIIESNPILEAFGNAKTVKNDNSSRFGKFIQIKFNGGNICGANIEKYLLEKSRITGQNSNERNYHIFYQLLCGADTSLKQALFLDGGVEDYRFLRGGCPSIDGVDDSERFKELRNCMRALDIDEETELFYYKIVAAVLHLGNLEFRMNNKQVEIVNIGTVDKICKLLKISSSDFIKCLIHPEIKAGHEVVTHHRTVEQVYRIVEALAKILYDKMFDSIISDLNRCLGTTINSNFIGVLDIAGFEIFQENSFEQLCINYTNEKLQQFFNHHMFILEQEIYRQEDIEWDFIDFGLDLQPTIELIESSNPIGVMAYLDEECVMPCASDRTFLEKLLRNVKSPKFKRINFKDGFKLQHYAGDVEYSVNDWITKNKDPNFESLTSLINKSEDAGVSSLSFTESKNLKKGFFRTVSQKHKDQLLSLMKTLSGTHPHFVRCIIPNLQKRGDVVENKLVLEQLKCNGVLEGIRISRQGFPSRMKYCEFVERYKLLCQSLDKLMAQSQDKLLVQSQNKLMAQSQDKLMAQTLDNKEMAQSILSEVKISPTQFRLGKTKIFFRQSVLADIEDLRDSRISLIMKEVQSVARRKMALRKINIEELRKKSIVCLKKNGRLCVDLQQWNWWKLYLKIKPLLDVRKRDNEIKEKESTIKKYGEALEKEKGRVHELEKKVKELVESRSTLLKSVESEKQYTLEKDELMKGIRVQNKELEKRVKKEEEERRKTQEERVKERERYEKALEEVQGRLRTSLKKVEELEEKEKANLLLLNTESQSKSQFKQFLETKEKEIEKLKRRVQECEQEKEEDGGKADENVKKLKEEVSFLKEEKESLRMFSLKENNFKESKIKKMKEELSDLQIENERLEKEKNKFQKQAEEKEKLLKKKEAEKDVLKVKNENLLKTVVSLKEEVEEGRRFKEETLRITTQGDKLKGLEKKIKGLVEKNKHLESVNLQLVEEKEEIHRENLNLLQSKLDDIFQRESEFNSVRNKLQVENQRLINENQRISRELYEQRVQSESSDDSNSGTEKLYSLLEQEKKIRREAEQRVIEKESENCVLRRENEEMKEEMERKEKEREKERKERKESLTHKSTVSTLQKEVDGLQEEVNRVLLGINTKYFPILQENRERLRESLREVEKREREIKDLEGKLLESSSKVCVLEERNRNLEILKKINEKKINSLSSEFDTLRVSSSLLETEVEEKTREIEKYKEEIERLCEEGRKCEMRYQEEVNSLREEKETHCLSLKEEYSKAILSLKKEEGKSKKLYDEKIQSLLEIEKKKRESLKEENEKLKKERKDLEEKLKKEIKLICELNYKLREEEILKMGRDKIGDNSDNSKNSDKIGDKSINSDKINELTDTERISKPSTSPTLLPPSKFILKVLDKQKLKDLEMKSLVFSNQLKENKQLIDLLKEDVERIRTERDLLMEERLSLKNKLFELKRENNVKSVKLCQVERELKDEKELVNFLKPFSLGRKK